MVQVNTNSQFAFNQTQINTFNQIRPGKTDEKLLKIVKYICENFQHAQKPWSTLLDIKQLKYSIFIEIVFGVIVCILFFWI